MPHTISLPFGDNKINIDIPKGWQDICDIHTNIAQNVNSIDPSSLATSAFAPYISYLKQYLSSGSNQITIVIDDATRPTPIDTMFPLLMHILQDMGCDISDISLVVACGTHKPMSVSDIIKRLGGNTFGIQHIENHDCNTNLLNFGTTSDGVPLLINKTVASSKLVFLLGTIEPHPMAGFGGGYKNILPGCAGLELIKSTHMSLSTKKRFGHVGDANCPVRLSLEKKTQELPFKCFMFNSVLDQRGNIVEFYCGDPINAHRQGCVLAQKIWGVAIPRRADIAIVSSNPMNYDLCQGSKCLGNALRSVKDGGLILAFTNNNNGFGDLQITQTDDSYFEIRDYIREHGATEYEINRNKFKSVSFYERFMLQNLAETLSRVDVFMYSPHTPGVNKVGLFNVFDTVDEMMCVASKLFPEAQYVTSGSGGVCFGYVENESLS